MDSITEKHILENGLTVLMREIHHVPLVSHWIWYQVGSRDEPEGQTGLSHWVEHMQFKGTIRYPVHVLDQIISRDGGVWNAMTYLDWTAYFETLPSQKIDIALDLEADRMRNSIFDVKEIELERTVVISEREGNENEPIFRLSEAVRKAAFHSHPYRHEVIGEMEDLKRISPSQLINHYRKHYVPDNAVLAIAGNFKTSELLKRIEHLYGSIPAGNGKRTPAPDEESPPEEKRVELEGPGDTIYLEINYPSPSAGNEDIFSLLVLDSILTGPSSLAMFSGGSVSNKTSRLYQHLVEKDLAVSVSGGIQATIDPFLYGILTILPPDQSVDKVIKAVDQEIDELKSHKIGQGEIHRAIKQAKAIFAYGSESITNQAFWMGYASMFADHTWFDTFIHKLEAVTPDSIQKSAQKYLKDRRRVIGIYRSKREKY